MKILVNYLYSISYQIFSIIIPLVTLPYVSRILTPNGLGLNSFSLSFAQLFVVIGLLGFKREGNKAVARSITRADRSESFFKIYIAQFISCLFSLVMYVVFVVIFYNENLNLYLVQSLYIIAAMFDVSWYFQGKENFKKTVLRGMTSKILGCFLIFIFVKNQNDFYIYGFVLAFSNLTAQILLWISLFKEKEISFGDIKKFNIISFIDIYKKSFIIFIPLIGKQIYSITDSLILGLTSGQVEVAFYANTVKIINIPMYIVTSFGIVMLPRMTAELSKKNVEKFKLYIENSTIFMSFLAFPLTFGIIAVSNNFSKWFFGDQYYGIWILICILALKIIPVTIGEIFSIQVLVPMEKNKEYSIAALVGAVSAVILNTVLSLIYGAIGTTITFVLVEVIVTSVILYFSKDYISVLFNKEFIKYFISSIIMMLSIYPLNNLSVSPVLLTVIQILVGITVYVSLVFLFKCKIFKVVKKFF